MFTLARHVALIFVCFYHNGAYGSQIKFSSSQAEIHTNLTSTLTLRCELTDTTSTGGGSVIGRSLADTARSLTHTDTNVQYLTSLVVTRDGSVPVASISEHSPATPLADLANLKVTGQINGSAGYLELTWRHPTDIQASEYYCEANGVNAMYHGEMYSTSIEVTSRDPQPMDLFHYIRELMTELEQQKVELDSVKKELQESRHTETGLVDCGGSDHWTDHTLGLAGETYTGHDHRSTNVTKSFTQVYDHAPVVHISVEHMYSQHTANTYYFIELVDVTTTDFTVRCRGTLDNRIIDLQVLWTSIPH